MNVKNFVTLVPILCLACVQAKAQGLSIPTVDARADTSLYGEQLGELPQCQDFFNPPKFRPPATPIDRQTTQRSPSRGLIAEIIGFANRQFERRWTGDFLAERFKIAMKYAGRSRYVVYRKAMNDGTSSDPIVGSIGITYDFSADGRDGGLPLEETLRLKKLPRPRDSSGRSAVFELRTYAKDKVAGAKAFPALFSSAIKLVFSLLEDYPELYEQPVLYTYGDATSIRFYRHLGFEVMTDIEPVEHGDRRWWVLRTSPRTLEQQLTKIFGPRYLGKINQPIEATLPSGLKALAQPQSSVYLDGQNNSARLMYVHGETEVMPGIFAADKSRLDVFSESEQSWFLIIEKISRAVFMKEAGVWIPAGSSLKVYHDGTILGSNKLSETLDVPMLNVKIKEGGGVFFAIANYSDPRKAVAGPFKTLECVGVENGNQIVKGVATQPSVTARWRLLERENIWQPFELGGTLEPWPRTPTFLSRFSSHHVYIQDDGKVVQWKERERWQNILPRQDQWIP